MYGQIWLAPNKKQLLPRFWQSASGFWRGPSGWQGRSLVALLIVVAILELLVQYWMNFWSRDFFDALSSRDGTMLGREAKLFLPLAGASTALAVLSVWSRMTIQRQWREWLSRHLLARWLSNSRYRHLKFLNGENQNAEYRIAEDARGATEAPIDLALGLLASALAAVAFMQVLWNVGGGLTVTIFGLILYLPGYLVTAAVVYSASVTAATMVIGRNLTRVVEGKNQTESEFRSAASQLRHGNSDFTQPKSEGEKRRAIDTALGEVIARWRDLCWQLMRTTLISHSNFLVAPVIALMLCAPKYLDGSISLGEVVQASAAFVTVLNAFSWLVDNYPHVADWRSSVNRVASLLQALDEFESRVPQSPVADLTQHRIKAQATSVR